MAVSIKKHFSFEGSQQEIELKRAFTAVLNDNTALRASIVGITAKLDADAGVTDTNYAATLNPAVLELTA